MTSHASHRPVSALRARMIEDMKVRGFTEKPFTTTDLGGGANDGPS